MPAAALNPKAMRPADIALLQMGLISPSQTDDATASSDKSVPLAAAVMDIDDPSDPIIQYYVADHSLGMSSGKLAAQAAHAATLSVSDLERKRMVASDTAEIRDYETWLSSDMRKVVLRGSNKDLIRLEEAGGYAVRDNGNTEIAPGSLTVVALRPMPKSQAAPLVKRLQVYRDKAAQ